VDVVVDVFDLWHVNVLLLLLHHGHLTMLVHRDVDMVVDVVDLRHFDSPL
jgi:hypothetical protein